MLCIGSVVTNCSDVPRAATFWSAALGYTPRHPTEDRWALLGATDGRGPNLTLDADDRTHLDLYTDSLEEQAREVDRLLGLGAIRVEWTYPDGADFVVLADPTGTLFCVVAG